MNGIIYLAVNRVNGKAYVGQTTGSLRNRAMEHLREGKQTFCRALRKYGLPEFDWVVLENVATSVLNEREAFWIKHLGSLVPSGYNRSDGRIGPSGYRHTSRTKLLLSEIRTQTWKSPEYRDKLRASHWSRSARAEEIKESLSRRTKLQHEGGQLGGYRGGGIKTEESRKKASESAKRVWADPAYKAAMAVKKSDYMKVVWAKRRLIQCEQS